MNTKISLKRAVELIKNADHNKVDVSHIEDSTGEVFIGAESEHASASITVVVSMYRDGVHWDDEFFDISDVELVDGRYIKLIDDEMEEEFNVYLFNLVPITNLVAE